MELNTDELLGMKIVDFRKEIQEIGEEDLLDLKAELDERIAGIVAQLVEAKSNAAQFGEYADSDWFRRATLARKLTGQKSQVVQHEIRRRKKQRISAPHLFIDAAKALLTAEAYEQIWELTNEMVAVEKEKRGLV